MSKQTAPQEFSARHIAELRERFSQLETVNPTGPTWQHFEKYVKALASPLLRQLEAAEIKWLSGLARLELVSRGLL